MDLEPFFQICKETAGRDKQWAEAFCETLEGVFDDGLFADMDKVCRLFYGRGKRLSKAQFYRKKKYIVELYQWLAREGQVFPEFLEQVENLKMDDVISTDELSRFYFRSIDSALGYIAQIGMLRSMNKEDDLLPVKAIVILTWYQTELGEMTAIRKSDLNAGEKSVQISGENPRTITLDEKSFRLLKLYADAEEYNSFPGGGRKSYQPSVYLFRSNRSDHLNENNLKCFCKRFNAEADAGQLISLLAIRRCGIFCEVSGLLEKSKNESVNAAIQKIAKCDRQMAFGYAKLYGRWKQKFHVVQEK